MKALLKFRINKYTQTYTKNPTIGKKTTSIIQCNIFNVCPVEAF